jgi:Uma2 family endonuclease
MTAVGTSAATVETVADLLEQLGGIPPRRVRARPFPGAAIEQDVLDVYGHEGRLCELVDGMLVEKGVGFRESFLAIALSAILWGFVRQHNLGLVTGADGMVRLASGLVRIPDVAFVSWDRLPGRRVPVEPIPGLAPDLVVEVLSESNTEGEMARKRREYFTAGVRIVWLIDPEGRTVEVFVSEDQSTVLDEGQTLDGGNVLPGFTLLLGELFAELDRHGHGDANDS